MLFSGTSPLNIMSNCTVILQFLKFDLKYSHHEKKIDEEKSLTRVKCVGRMGRDKGTRSK